MQRELAIEEAFKAATIKGLVPARVKGHDFVVLTKDSLTNLEPITWDSFKEILLERDLQVYDLGGYLKIMRRQSRQILLSTSEAGLEEVPDPSFDGLERRVKKAIDDSVSENADVLKALSED